MARLRQEADHPSPGKGRKLRFVFVASAAMGTALACGVMWVTLHPRPKNLPQPGPSIVRVAPEDPLHPDASKNNFFTAPLHPQLANGGVVSHSIKPILDGNVPFLIRKRDGKKIWRTAHSIGLAQNKTGAVDQSVVDDMAYINAAEPERVARANTKPQSGKPLGDDFIFIPLPQVALADRTVSSAILVQAVEQYQKEKAVVDARLAQPVTVEMKGGDLKELIDTLTAKTGVRFYVTKDLEDVKLTVLIKDTPVRDLMRQVVKLFNLEWRRAGEEGKFRYTLLQTLKQRLAEEELKRKDQDEILLNVQDQLKYYEPYLNSPPDQMKRWADEARQKAESAGSGEAREAFREQQRIFEILSHPLGLDALKLFLGLTPDQFVELRDSGQVKILFDGTLSGLPVSVVKDIQADNAGSKIDFRGYAAEDLPLDKIAASVSIQMDSERYDRADLQVLFDFGNKEGGPNPGTPVILTTGVPKVLQSGDLSPRSVTLHDDRLAKRVVSLDPRPEHPLTVDEGSPLRFRLWDLDHSIRQNFNALSSAPEPENPAEWVDSAEVWAEVHRKTGLNILSDYYLRVYSRRLFSQDGRLADLLANDAGVLRVDAESEGSFLRLRRPNYYSERTMDVPNRLLTKWSEARRKRGYLDLNEMAEMAQLPRPVFWEGDLHRAILMKWNLMEWKAAQYAQNPLRLFASLTSEQKLQIQSDRGLDLSVEQVKALYPPDFDREELASVQAGRMFMRLREPGWYIWRWKQRAGSEFLLNDAPVFPGQEPVREKVKAMAQAKARAYVKEYHLAGSDIRSSPEDEVEGPGAGIWFCFPMDGKYKIWDDWYDR
jgi:hypothetical protein